MVDHGLDFLFQEVEIFGIAWPGVGDVDSSPPFGPFRPQLGQKRLALLRDDVGEGLEIIRPPVRVAGGGGRRSLD